jgi:hypothetical protein
MSLLLVFGGKGGPGAVEVIFLLFFLLFAILQRQLALVRLANEILRKTGNRLTRTLPFALERA